MQVVLEKTTSPGVYTFSDRFRVVKIDPHANKSKWRLDDLHTGEKHPLGRMKDGVGLIESLLAQPLPKEETKAESTKVGSKADPARPVGLKEPTFVDQIKEKFGTLIEILAFDEDQAKNRLERRFPDTVVLGISKISKDRGVAGYAMRATLVPLHRVWASIPDLFPR